MNDLIYIPVDELFRVFNIANSPRHILRWQATEVCLDYNFGDKQAMLDFIEEYSIILSPFNYN